MTQKKPAAVNITIKPDMLKVIVEEHIRGMNVESQEHEPNSIEAEFWDDQWEEASPTAYITIYY